MKEEITKQTKMQGSVKEDENFTQKFMESREKHEKLESREQNNKIVINTDAKDVETT